jgi:hypothetical protein
VDWWPSIGIQTWLVGPTRQYLIPESFDPHMRCAAEIGGGFVRLKPQYFFCPINPSENANHTLNLQALCNPQNNAFVAKCGTCTKVTHCDL